MKPLLHVVLFLPLLALAQTSQVHIAGNSYPVEFGDATLSVTNRQRIATDLTIIFSPATSFEDSKGKEDDVTSGQFAPNVFKTMFLSGEKNEGIFVLDQNAYQRVRVEKTASDKYLQSFALMKTHSNAVGKVNAFVAMMNDPNLQTKPIQVLRDMFHYELKKDGITPVTDADVRAYVAEVIQPFRCRGFSALHFSLEQRPEVNGAEVLVISLCLFGKAPEEEGDPPISWPILFHNGRWGFGHFP